jgi:hypothetical protein
MMDEENLFVGVAWVTSTDHFDEYNNCSHEGTNCGLKSHADGVLLGHSIDYAAKCLTYRHTEIC